MNDNSGSKQFPMRRNKQRDDNFISIHGEDFLFYGSTPRNARSCLNKAGLSIGINTTNPNQVTGAKTRQHLERNIFLSPSVSTVFAKRYNEYHFHDKHDMRNDDQLTVKSLKILIDKAWLQKQISISEGTVSTEKFALRYEGILAKRKQSRDPSQLSPIQLLDAFCIALNSEYTSLNFDYIILHIRCMKLLREIHTEIQAECREWLESMEEDTVPDDWETSDAVLHFLLVYILKHHVQSIDQVGEQRWKIERHRGRAFGTLFLETNEIVDRFVKEEGSVELDKIRKLKDDSLEARLEPGEVEELNIEEKEKFSKRSADRGVTPNRPLSKEKDKSEGDARSGVDEKGKNEKDAVEGIIKNADGRKSKRTKIGAKQSSLDAANGFEDIA